MFPIGDDNSSIRSTAYVTYGLIVLNSIVFLYEWSLGRGIERFAFTYGSIPEDIVHGKHIHTLLTSMFVHGGFLHIVGNMLYLRVFGDNIEDRWGKVPFLGFYIIAGLAAACTHILLNPDSSVPMVGASGAISGCLGAYVVLFPKNNVRVLLGWYPVSVPAFLMIGFWALQQFLSTFATISMQQLTGVAYAAHAGGFLAGTIIALIYRLFDNRVVEPPSRGYGSFEE